MRSGQDDAVRALAARDHGIEQTLTMLATDQRSLIEAARVRFDERSDVRPVEELFAAHVGITRRTPRRSRTTLASVAATT